MSATLVTRQSCRVCGAPLTPVLSLGKQQIAGGFGDGSVQRRIPLELVRCDPAESQGACGLVQLRHTVPGSILYSSYWYRSGVNQTMTDNLHGIARQCQAQVGELTERDVVLDIGCNDGTLLDAYGTGRRVGFDPCDAAEYAEGRGHEIVRDFFTADEYNRRCGTRAKIVTSIAMFYDLDDPVSFVYDVAAVLAPDGVWCLELHYLPAMLDANGFDAIVHEHVAYYSLAVIEHILGQASLEVVGAKLNGVNGGSIRLFVGHRGRLPYDDVGLRRLRVREFEMGLDTGKPYERFRRRVEQVKHDLRDMCERLADQGKTIHVYGASTKGNTILQYCKIGPELVPAAADRNPDKWGSETSTGIPIISEQDSRDLKPGYYLALPWHFLDEFLRRESEFLGRGGQFIVPLPQVVTRP